MEPFDLILPLSLIFSLTIVIFSLSVHKKKVGEILKNAGLSYPDRVKIQINDPYISWLWWSWVAAVAALFVIVAMPIILKFGIRGGVPLIFIISLFSLYFITSLLGLPIPDSITRLFSRLLPGLGKESEHQEEVKEKKSRSRCYQECGISPNQNYKKISGRGIFLAILSIVLVLLSYSIPYCSRPIMGPIMGVHLHVLASSFFAICIFFLFSPLLKDWWRWGKKFKFLKSKDER